MTTHSFPIRPEVQAFEPYSPGLSIDEIRERYGLDSVIKMASNENPLGISPVVLKTLQDHAAYGFRYAQSGTPRLIHAIAGYHGIDERHIVAGNGSDEIIDLLLRVVPTPGEHNVVACRPSFSMYRIQSKLCGVEFRSVPLLPDFSFDRQKLLEAVDERTALVFITTPDNPSGWCPRAVDVASFARELPSDCLLVVDEAYMDFCHNQSEFSLLPRFSEFPNLVILRTFSKAYGLAGVRLGYGIMPIPLADAMRSVHMPFSVNVLAEAAGIAAVQDSVFYEATLKAVAEGRAYLAEAMTELGCMVYPSEANFIMFQPSRASVRSAQEIFQLLLSQGLIIRPLTSYGLPTHLRVSVGSMDENRRFITLLTEAMR